jgi:ribonuclease P protein component
MLKKPFRLSSKYEFNLTRRKGQAFKGEFFTLYLFKPNNYEGPAKVGFVVSNKLSKSAVKRNGLKRLFREAVRANYDKIKPGYWVVIYPKLASLNKKYEDINTDFIETIQKIFVAR